MVQPSYIASLVMEMKQKKKKPKTIQPITLTLDGFVAVCLFFRYQELVTHKHVVAVMNQSSFAAQFCPLGTPTRIFFIIYTIIFLSLLLTTTPINYMQDLCSSTSWRKPNRPFSSSPRPLYQNEVRCSTFDMEMTFHSHANKTHFHKNGWAPNLVLIQRPGGTRKWPIQALRVQPAAAQNEEAGTRNAAGCYRNIIGISCGFGSLFANVFFFNCLSYLWSSKFQYHCFGSVQLDSLIS